MNVRNRLLARAHVQNPLAKPWVWITALAFAAAALCLDRPAAAQAEGDTVLPAEQIEELVGPIALYPDDLVGIVLPASTYPLQVVEAARFLENRKSDPNLEPDEDWDDSIVALLNYPEVLALLNEDLDWTWDLGTAVLNQRSDVLEAIQAFRDRAYQAGNLRTDSRQVVTEDDGAITIAPADPKVIYVPYYEPREVVVYQAAPVFSYYPWGYPVYYYPYPVGYRFHTGLFFGVTSAFAIGWHSHLLNIYHYGYVGHPYYGWSYYEPFYARNYIHVHVGGSQTWQPRYRYGNRPITRSYEGRVADGGATRPTRSVPGAAYRGRTPARTEGAGGTAGRSTYRSVTPGSAATQRSTLTGQPSRLSRAPTGSGTQYRAPGTTGTGTRARPGTPTTTNVAPRATPPSTAGGGSRFQSSRAPSTASPPASSPRVYRGAPGAADTRPLTVPRAPRAESGRSRAAPAPAPAPSRAATPSGGNGGNYRQGNSNGGRASSLARAPRSHDPR